MDRVSVISLIVGAVIPLLTAAVTKSSWPIWAKQLLTAVLSGLTGLGVDLEHSGGPVVTVIIANALTTFATAAAVLSATWKPTGAIAKLESVFIRDATAPPFSAPFSAPTSVSASLAQDADTVSVKQPPNIN